MISRMLRLALGALLLLSAGTGCASRVLTSANAGGLFLELEPQDYQVVASVQGKDCTPRIFGFTFTNPDLLSAEMDAMRSAPGSNLLVNKHVYSQTETVLLFLFGNVCFYVEGIAVTLR